MYSSSYQGKRHAALVSALLFSGALSVTGCASTEQRGEQSANIVEAAPRKVTPVDPYEGFNRSMYGFNMGLDRYFLKPVANSYKFITPDFMQTGVTNFFNNLKGINVVLNDFLQGKFGQGAEDTGRFLTNSTVGVLGLFDVATDLGFQNNVEDFGQTLAVWGVDQGPYLVLPIMGPTTVRDGAAVVVDKAANPGTYVPGTGIVEGINDRANAEGALNFIDEAALDPYVFMRESFLQYRQNLINDGKTDASNYDLDVDAALEDEAAEAPKEAAKVSKDATKAKPAAPATPTGTNGKKPQSPVSVNKTDAGHNGGTAKAFDSMSKSFENAADEFKQASMKMDEISKKKRRYKRY